jgi:hypothetical protein
MHHREAWHFKYSLLVRKRHKVVKAGLAHQLCAQTPSGYNGLLGTPVHRACPMGLVAEGYS